MTADRVPATAGGDTQAYGKIRYWDNRYAKDSTPFDWYQDYPSLAPLIRLYIPRPHRVLVVGCGNSAFSESMVDDGYHEVVNIDSSSVLIEAMKEKHSNHPKLKYMKMDVRDMSSINANSFDAVVDNGTLDSHLCGQNSRQNAEKLESGNSSDDQNKDLMVPIPLDTKGETVLGKNNDVHYIYVCIKDNHYPEKSVEV